MFRFLDKCACQTTLDHAQAPQGDDYQAVAVLVDSFYGRASEQDTFQFFSHPGEIRSHSLCLEISINPSPQYARTGLD